MRYNKITKFDISNGPGIRTVLWVSGCTHRCKECHNPETWDPHTGFRFTSDTVAEILESLKPDYISGLTLSGGDPLHPSNLRDISNLVFNTKVIYPTKSIWLYTGYTWEQLIKEYPIAEDLRDLSISKILSNIDVLVDGPFDINKKDISLPYCGSRNQRVIDVQESLSRHTVILYEGK